MLQPQSSEVSLTLAGNSDLAKKVNYCVTRYGDSAQFIETFKVANMRDYVATLSERMYCGTAPSLLVARTAYGDKVVEAWIALYIVDLITYMGINIDSSNDSQDICAIRDTSKNIMTSYGYLKVTELMMAFYLMRTGEIRTERGENAANMYGRFRGDVIMDCLYYFKSIRSNKISELEGRHNVEKVVSEFNSFLRNNKLI